MGSVDEATLQVLSQMQPDDRLVVLGSFFTVAGVLRAVTHNHQSNITQVLSEIN